MIKNQFACIGNLKNMFMSLLKALLFPSKTLRQRKGYRNNQNHRIQGQMCRHDPSKSCQRSYSWIPSDKQHLKASKKFQRKMPQRHLHFSICHANNTIRKKIYREDVS